MLNNKDVLQRIHWNVTCNYSCLLCAGGHHENMDHFFSHAILVLESGVTYRLNGSIVMSCSRLLSQLEEVLDIPSCWGGFFFLACWNILKVRNAIVFEPHRRRYIYMQLGVGLLFTMSPFMHIEWKQIIRRSFFHGWLLCCNFFLSVWLLHVVCN
jgi:hypothetical protein